MLNKIFGSGKDPKCVSCNSKIESLEITPMTLMVIMSGGKDAANAQGRSVGGKCPKCQKYSCMICYLNSKHGKYSCPNCGAKIPSFNP